MSNPDKKLLKAMVTVPRRWSSLPTLDWYVLREFLIKFSILILVCAMLFVLGDVFNDLSDFLENDAPLSGMLTYFLLRLPGNISFVLPISVLLGCMWTMAMFGKNLEVTAMRASGLSLMRCARSIFFMGLVVSVVNIYFNEILVPDYNDRAQILKANLSREDLKKTDLDKVLTYKSMDRRRTWLFRSFDDNGEHLGVSVKFYREDNTMDKYLSAEKAVFSPDKGWSFFNGTVTKYSRDGFMPKNPEDFTELTLAMTEVPEDPHTIETSVKSAELLPCWTILEIIMKTENMAQRLKDNFWTLFFYRLAFPWASFIAVFLGVPLATKNERSGIMLAVISAVVVIVAYIVISEAFKLFGRQGIINPLIAGFTPTLAFIVYGWWNVRRNRV